jgi:glycolate oxidase iron-sulfur subunit
MAKAMGPVVFHPPCTLQHGQQIKGLIEGLLEQLGFDLRMPSGESHLCCGSAGTYSILQSKLSEQLKTRKLQHLQNSQAQWILSANVGCISHLQSQSPIRVSHWIEAVDSAMAPSH